MERLRLDATKWESFQRCPYYYYIKWEEGWKPDRIPAPLSFGTLCHTSWQMWYDGKDEKECLKVWDNYKPPEGEQKRTKEKGIDIMKYYFGRYNRKDFEVLATEKKFDLPIGKYTYFGRMDGVVKWGGLTWVLENKTTRTLGLSFFEGFRPNLQCYGYVYACQKLYGQCAGMLVNGLLVSASMKNDAKRLPVTPTPDELLMWEDAFVSDCDEISKRRNDVNWTRRFGNCHKFYSKCDLYRICLYGDYSGWKKEEK